MDRGYGQYCPVAKGAEVLAARWIPLIIRNLDLGVPQFSARSIRACPVCPARCSASAWRPWNATASSSGARGDLPRLGQAIEAGAWETRGPPSLARALVTWGGLSPFARVVPACDDQATAGPAPSGR